MLAARPGRDLLGAFSKEAIANMDAGHVATVRSTGTHVSSTEQRPNTLRDLILECELVVLSANSNHIEEDLFEACRLREELGREQGCSGLFVGIVQPRSNYQQRLCAV